MGLTPKLTPHSQGVAGEQGDHVHMCMGATETGYETEAACKTEAGYKKEYRRLPDEGQPEYLVIQAPTGLPRDDPRGTLPLGRPRGETRSIGSDSSTSWGRVSLANKLH